MPLYWFIWDLPCHCLPEHPLCCPICMHQFSSLPVARRNTLLSHQVPYSRLHSATTAALKQMQASNFIRPCRAALPEKKGMLLLPAGAASGGAAAEGASGRGSGGTAATAFAAAGAQSPLGKNYFRATEKGSAVYKTGLPIPLGLELYDR